MLCHRNRVLEVEYNAYLYAKYKYIFKDLLKNELEKNETRKKYMNSAPGHVHLYHHEPDRNEKMGVKGSK